MINFIIVGHVAQVRDLNQVNGKAVQNFSVATNRRYTTESGEQREDTIFVEIAMWGNRTNVMPYIRVGDPIAISADWVTLNPYMTKEGKLAAAIRLNNPEIKLLGKRDKSQPQQQPQTSQPEEDDVPF